MKKYLDGLFPFFSACLIGNVVGYIIAKKHPITHEDIAAAWEWLCGLPILACSVCLILGLIIGFLIGWKIKLKARLSPFGVLNNRRCR